MNLPGMTQVKSISVTAAVGQAFSIAALDVNFARTGGDAGGNAVNPDR